MAMSIRERQTFALLRMLSFDSAPPKNTALAEPQWKILVYDRFGQDIISPLLSVRELRDNGVTLHLLLHSDREAIPEVPVIYFVMPTDENVQRICQDFHNQLYETYYLNFISAIPRQKLEDLALGSIQANLVHQVTKVVDQHLNFISLEDDLFCLRYQDREAISYYALNRGNVKDTEMEMILDTMVDSLFSAFVTTGQVPVIRAPRGNAAEMVAEKLDKKFRENLRDSRNSLFASDGLQSGQFSFQRPLLVILDRNVDLATPLHHTWTYQALVHDVLDLNLNRVTLQEETSQPSHHGAATKLTKKVYDVGHTDKFWQQQKGCPFPAVAEAVQENLEEYRASEGQVKQLKHDMGLDNESDETITIMTDSNSATAKLTSAVTSLPELLEKKRLIDMHTNIATALLEKIKERKLDLYFETEEKIMSKSTAIERQLMDIITDSDAGSCEDKLRLFLLYYLLGPSICDTEFEQYSAALENAGCDMQPLDYIKRFKVYNKMTAAPSQYGGGGTKTVNMFSKLVSQGSQFVMEGVKNLVVKKHKLPVTRIVDSLMEQKSMPEAEDFRYFDPKLLRASNSNSVPRNRTPFQDAVVFLVGGGNYIEYQNLVDYAKDKVASGNPKRIIYGCSEVMNASSLLKQFSSLGGELV